MEKMKKMIKKVMAFVLVIVVIYSCNKEMHTNTIAYLYNHTSVPITILCYKNGIVLKEDTIHLLPRDSFLFGMGSEKGDLTIPMFSSTYSGNLNDIREVVFENEYKVEHCLNIPPILGEKYYLIENLRNINNPNNYEFEMVRNRKERINYHRYYFTESDYEYAKD